MFPEFDDREATLADVALESVVVVAPATSIADSARLLDRGSDTLVVASEPLRQVTARDIVHAVASGVPSERPVTDLDLEEPVVLLRSTRVDAAIQRLVASQRCHAIVQDAGTVAGRLTMRDAARFPRPAWVRALQLALHIENTTTLEMER